MLFIRSRKSQSVRSQKAIRKAVTKTIFESLEDRTLMSAYSVQWLGHVSASDNFSSAQAINDHGMIAGDSWVQDASTIPGQEKVFTWTASGGMVGQSTLNGNAAYASGINNNGLVVGKYHYPVSSPGTTAGGGYYEWAAQWQNNVASTVAGQAWIGMMSAAYGTNDSNVIVGVTTGTTGNDNAFVYNGSSLRTLGALGGIWSYAMDINNNNVVAGFADTGENPNGGQPGVYVSRYHAAIWDASGNIRDLGTLGTDSYAYKINESGWAVGSSVSNADGYYHAILWNGTKLLDIGIANQNSEALSINNAGQVVGDTVNWLQSSAWIYENGAMTDLNTLTVGLNTGDSLCSATDINNLGQIVGYGLHNGVYEAFVLNPDGVLPPPPPSGNLAPIAAVAGPVTLTEGNSLTLDASASTDPDGDVLNFTWDINGDGVYGDAIGSMPTLAWADLQALGITAGSTYNVSVVVDDGQLSSGAATTLTVDPAVITTTTVTTTVTGPTDGYNGVSGQTRTIHLGATDSDAEIEFEGFTYSIDWGDGQTSVISGSNSESASHVYGSAGSMEVSVTAADANGSVSDVATLWLDIQSAEVQGSVLAIGATDGYDSLTLTAGSTAGTIVTPYGVFTASSVRVYGGAGTDAVTVQGTSSNEKFTVEPGKIKINGVGITGDSVESWKVNGGAGTDTVDYSGYGSAVTVNLKSGIGTGLNSIVAVEGYIGSATVDTLLGADVATTWKVTATNAGTAGTVTFSSFENLTGGAGNDTYILSSAKGVTGAIDGGAGVNTIDYSAYTAAVTVNLGTGAATNVGGRLFNTSNVIGGTGSDSITGNALDNVLLGSAGNDSISGIGGNDVLVGAAGNDVLTGSTGRNILIGGAGSDKILGGGSDDILIGGSTNYDANVASLTALMAEWKRTDLTFQQRQDHLRGTTAGGLNGSSYLKSTTVKDDSNVDTMTGGAGVDWFWGKTSEITDLVTGEKVN